MCHLHVHSLNLVAHDRHTEREVYKLTSFPVCRLSNMMMKGVRTFTRITKDSADWTHPQAYAANLEDKPKVLGRTHQSSLIGGLSIVHQLSCGARRAAIRVRNMRAVHNMALGQGIGWSGDQRIGRSGDP